MTPDFIASLLGRPATVLARSFYARDPRVVAPALLNKILLRADGRSGRIVETEAYCGTADPAAHSWRGRTARNATMFGPAGLLYVYFTYGMHWCCNPVCGEEGEGVAVLLRALAPLTGLAAMRAARPRCRHDRDLCRGPARLCQALGIDGAQDGIDLVEGAGGFVLVDDGVPPPAQPGVSPRIGITRAAEEPWRWYVANDRHVSR
ncbi:MAG TPA: DNA-3-methyladenine glycosylase [Frateuria sp.]|uniref:DNA-3-methyladenine glycosylase n=1 Tax=Frateuria sp. TaxID=2211372 RepID=UPI002D7F480B|nr:DNA-3-methyladenine glycosylase [Frateuria sp.]HET6806408.1 DNA-3-methyladenine glycosylase [Frateuria sp.]